MSKELTCVGCGRKVEVNKYQGQEPYHCAKCRGIEMPRKQKLQSIQKGAQCFCVS